MLNYTIIEICTTFPRVGFVAFEMRTWIFLISTSIHESWSEYIMLLHTILGSCSVGRYWKQWITQKANLQVQQIQWH